VILKNKIIFQLKLLQNIIFLSEKNKTNYVGGGGVLECQSEKGKHVAKFSFSYDYNILVTYTVVQITPVTLKVWELLLGCF
jgi:hypothetical protein